jgi:hypothetical protein
LSSETHPASPINNNYSGKSAQTKCGVRFFSLIESEGKGNVLPPGEGAQARWGVATGVRAHDNKFDVAPVL